MILRQLIVFISVMVVASIGFTPDATAKYRISVPLTDSVLEAVPTEPPVVLAKGGKRPQAQVKQAAKTPAKRTKPVATLKKPTAGQRKPSVSHHVKNIQFQTKNLSVSGAAKLGKSRPLENRRLKDVKASLRQKSKVGFGLKLTKQGEKSSLKGHTLIGKGSLAFSAIKNKAYRAQAAASFSGEVRAYRLESPMVVHRRWGGGASELGSPYSGRQTYKKSGNAARYQATHGSNNLSQKSTMIYPKGAIV
ncbi:hypothetical protein, partial [Sulfitobacter sp. HI0021]